MRGMIFAAVIALFAVPCYAQTPYQQAVAAQEQCALDKPPCDQIAAGSGANEVEMRASMDAALAAKANCVDQSLLGQGQALFDDAQTWRTLGIQKYTQAAGPHANANLWKNTGDGHMADPHFTPLWLDYRDEFEWSSSQYETARLLYIDADVRFINAKNLFDSAKEKWLAGAGGQSGQ